MIDHKTLTNEINELGTLRVITEAYAEIASVRMQRIRDFVLKNRDFLGAIDEIFKEVLSSYKKEVQSIVEGKKRGDDITFLSHNGKTVAVLLSANTGLYGDIVGKTFDLFRQETKDKDIEVAVIGRLGASLFEQVAPNVPFTSFDFPDYNVSEDQLAEIINHLVQYERINIYYGKFSSVVTQVPSVYKIAAVTPSTVKDQSEAVEDVKYLFEPSLQKILMFFETQIFASLLDQTMRESQLAKLASRITAMSKASENIKQNLDMANIKKLRLSHSTANRKQLNTVNGIISMIDG